MWLDLGTRFGGFLCLSLTLACGESSAQDYEREARWANETLSSLVEGEPVHLVQTNGHRVLALWQPAKQSRGAVIVVHGRGWSPDYEFYGVLRLKIAEAGYSTLSVQMPVLPGTAKFGDYLPTYPDAGERLGLAADWLRARGNAKLAIVSHSLGASMVNHYLINRRDTKVDAWVFISIINGLEDLFRVQVPVLDVYGSNDWNATVWGADERLAQIKRTPGSEQAVVNGARHFFEGKEAELTQIIVTFLDRVLRPPH